MSVEGEGSNEQTPQQTPQQLQQSSHPDLNFSLHDILNDTTHDENDPQFQTLVQRLHTNSNLEHPPATYDHLPVNLQEIFDGTDHLLNPQGNNPDASILQGGNLAHLWNQQHQQPQQQQAFMHSPQVQHNGSATATPAAVRPTPSPQQSNSNISTPSVSTPNTTHPQPQPQVLHTPTPPSHPQTPQQQPSQPPQQSPASSTTLLDNITAQLPPERKGRFIELFRELQTSRISAADFLAQAKSLLGQQQYQQLEDLKNKPSQQAKRHTPTPPTIRPAAAAASPMNMTVDAETRKRHAQIREEDAQRSMHGINTPPQKRAKVEHSNNNITNNNIPMNPPLNSLFNQQPLPARQRNYTEQQLHMSLQYGGNQQRQQGSNVYSNQIPMQFQQQNSQSQPHTPPPQKAMQQAVQAQPQMPLQTPPISLPPTNNNTPTTSAAAATIATPAISTPAIAATAAVATPAPVTTPVFKTPAVPVTPGLQVPTKASTPSISKAANAAATPATPATPIATGGGGGGGGDSRIDYDQLTDVMAYAGVDLKDETEHFIGDGGAAGGSLPDGIDRSKVQDFMNTEMLRAKILKYAKCVNIKEIDGDFISYIALAAQDRIRTVMESMVLASKHRTRNPFQKSPPVSEENGHPLFKIQVKQHVRSQLQAIERVSRQTEQDIDPPSSDEEQEDEDVLKDEKKKGWYSKKKKSKKVLEEMKAQQEQRKITVQDAIFVMERDVQGGRGCNQKALLRAYNEYLS